MQSIRKVHSLNHPTVETHAPKEDTGINGWESAFWAVLMIIMYLCLSLG